MKARHVRYATFIFCVNKNQLCNANQLGSSFQEKKFTNSKGQTV